jgi:murein DD-endopeptidase MepM/ murein hydrolase activator NlpD
LPLRRHIHAQWIAAVLACGLLIGASVRAQDSDESSDDERKGYDITPTGLEPKFPSGYDCPPLTSLYASWIDVDGTRRTERHSGVDGGRLNDPIIAPARGVIRAAWKANWGWGSEGAILMLHTSRDLGLDGDKVYLSEFDHLLLREAQAFTEGEDIARGQELARVGRPGNDGRYLPEVHWEVWEADDDDLAWHTNRYGGRFWRNASARLIDPLYLLGLNAPTDDDRAPITPFAAGIDMTKFRGFTYIFPCRKISDR